MKIRICSARKGCIEFTEQEFVHLTMDLINLVRQMKNEIEDNPESSRDGQVLVVQAKALLEKYDF